MHHFDTPSPSTELQIEIGDDVGTSDTFLHKFFFLVKMTP
jgi:hypothetical protein